MFRIPTRFLEAKRPKGPLDTSMGDALSAVFFIAQFRAKKIIGAPGGEICFPRACGANFLWPIFWPLDLGEFARGAVQQSRIGAITQWRREAFV